MKIRWIAHLAQLAVRRSLAARIGGLEPTGEDRQRHAPGHSRQGPLGDRVSAACLTLLHRSAICAGEGLRRLLPGRACAMRTSLEISAYKMRSSRGRFIKWSFTKVLSP